jgi:hypothetical protein
MIQQITKSGDNMDMNDRRKPEEGPRNKNTG